MDYLRYGGGGSKSGVTMGCKYRQRTGACCCDNPPIGCMEPEERRMRAKSGRTTPVAGVVRPSAVSASTGGIPAALPQAFSLQRRELQVPAFGGAAADAASAVAAGVRLIDASGDANIEAALKAAAPTQTDTLLATALPSLSELKGGQAAVKA
eukprot:CAMPEP_0177760314 /NCGR_PEP_ID=MMETSP0491_2-20121128/5203_1 /TAXON_ID=63592 /ORGANISM="Tetraselmis chuii, Strain PLY429" /LENGTH=152 /DNA_ID=CAMNT_0019276209 /DNA_START=257 /DNA_END=712 /DNA_ORIENTATION=+